jgi:amino-acid N-acetyltransferase
MNAPIFRRALPADWKAIRSLLAVNKLPLEGAREHLVSFVVVHDETGLLACGGLELYGSVALLRSVVVAEQHRGKLLGQEIVRRLFTSALDEGVETLVLLTDTAQTYFRRLGFKAVPRTELPTPVMNSAEFRGACPASATAMLMSLSTN